MKNRLFTLSAGMALSLLVGCAPVPQTDLDAAKAAIESAVTAQAADYAPDAFKQAQDANTKLEAELKKQEGASAFGRSYADASKLAQEVKSTAEKAAADAKANMEKMTADVAAMIEHTKAEIQGVKGDLGKLPKTKATVAAESNTQLTAVEAALSEADSALKAGRVKEAEGKVRTAMDAVSNVKSAMTASAAPPTPPSKASAAKK